MEKDHRYRIKSPTIAIRFVDGHRNIFTVPIGAVVRITEIPRPDDPLVDVDWNDEPYTMFVHDLRERGERFI